MSERALQLFKEAMAKRMETGTFTIELDCPPGGIRPGDIIADVIEGTGLPESEPVSKVFGQWTWEYGDVEGIAALWPNAQKLTKPRIEALYNRGVIRYGSW